ncbi:MAG TPA: hypothetical protein ENH78_11595, partial [Phycisphaerae bacterium]|nr:hypothetical protein [Phycisphaerae bacterium]
MMTRKNLALLAAADPWGLETGGCPGLGDRSDSWQMHGYALRGLGQDVPIIGSDIEATGKAGEKIVAALEAGDINAVAAGMEEGLEAIETGTAKLSSAWSDAAKFMMLFGGTVTAPILGAKIIGPAAAAGVRLPMWGHISKAKSAEVRNAGGTIRTVKVAAVQDFMDLVAAGWLFPPSAWDAISLVKPEPGGVYGEVWNPFGGRWQPSNEPLPEVGSAEAFAQEETSTAYQGDVLLRDVDGQAKNMPGNLALAALRVRAGEYAAANNGAIYAGVNPWG